MVTVSRPVIAYSGLATLLLMALIAGAPSLPTPAVRSSASGPESVASIPSRSTNPSPLKPLIPVDVLRVIDGDTVEVRAHVWLDQSIVTRVRLATIDAPELRARCPLEARKAADARNHLTALLAHETVYLAGLGRDKFGGRVTGRLLNRAGEDMAQQMLSAGHARPYDGKRRQGWC